MKFEPLFFIMYWILVIWLMIMSSITRSDGLMVFSLAIAIPISIVLAYEKIWKNILLMKMNFKIQRKNRR